MISFHCSHCGLKLRVKPEFAGRSSRCPTCRQPLTVPPPSRTQADVAPGPLAGTDSSLAKAGVEGGVSVEQARSGQLSIRDILARRTAQTGRYVIEGEIARGGMGAVLRAVDCDIRREVAVKFLLDPADPGKKARFVEEAQITGQLEHPNIPPIHELGVDAQQRLFFSMKMIRGRSLAQVLDERRKHPATAEKEYSLARLLTILVNVCNALAYGHSCGVVHRDLKPANIMLGDFGEVYVMDWGLAKVLRDATQATRMAGGPAPNPSALASSSSGSEKRPSKVETSRQPEADLTQDGAVLGTPVYMPPEQAAGHIGAIDQRSDIYSLGAILYEMLTLQPPVNKEGGYLAILLRVMEGEIVPPEQRASVPRELSAIAMKALARKPGDRYPTVEAFRRDIERFQEGRSVSAQQDSYGQAVWRLVKRNKLASAFTAVLAVVLAASSLFNYVARRDAEHANQEIRKRTEAAVPALVHSARLLANDWQLDKAQSQLDLAQQYDAGYAEVHLVKGQMRIAQKDFAGGRAELEQYLREQPQDGDARQLVNLCATGKPDDPAVLLAVAEVFQRQKLPGLTFRVLQDFQQSFEARRPLVSLYQKQIEANWPGLGSRLRLELDGQFYLSLAQGRQIASLDPLRGMQLHWLSLEMCDRVSDLSPLRGMPLRSLNLNGCRLVTDLTPLQGMPLTGLELVGCQVRDLSPLEGLPLNRLSVGSPLVTDLTPLQGLPLTSLSLSNCSEVTDLSPLRGLRLTSLHLKWCLKLRDLAPLQGMPLTSLNLELCQQVRDLTPLQGTKLTSLNVMHSPQIKDVTPLQGLPLTEIMLSPRNITRGMEGLRQNKSLKTICTSWELKDRMPVEEFWKRYDAGQFK